MLVTLARVEGKKICRKNRLEGTARPCWPRFYDAIRETFTIALTVPDGRTRFSIIFRGAFYWLYFLRRFPFPLHDIMPSRPLPLTHTRSVSLSLSFSLTLPLSFSLHLCNIPRRLSVYCPAPLPHYPCSTIFNCSKNIVIYVFEPPPWPISFVSLQHTPLPTVLLSSIVGETSRFHKK